MKTVNKTTLVLSTALLSSIALCGAQKKNSQDLVIRYVDSYAALSSSEDGKEFAKNLEKKRAELTVEIKKLEQEYAAAAKEFQAKASTLSESGREREQKKMVRLEREYKTKLQESEEDMKITMQSKQERLFREHQEAVQQYAKANDIDVVFGPGGILYASEKANCTNEVVAKMDDNRKVKLAKAKGAGSKKATA